MERLSGKLEEPEEGWHKSQKEKAKKNLILSSKQRFFGTSDEDSSDKESVVSQENYCIQPEKKNENNPESRISLILINGNGTLKNSTCLLDAGTSKSIVNKKLTDKKSIVRSSKKINWETNTGKIPLQRE